MLKINRQVWIEIRSVLLLGVIYWGLTKAGLPFGKFPGDLTYLPVVSGFVLMGLLIVVRQFLIWLLRVVNKFIS